MCWGLGLGVGGWGGVGGVGGVGGWGGGGVGWVGGWGGVGGWVGGGGWGGGVGGGWGGTSRCLKMSSDSALATCSRRSFQPTMVQGPGYCPPLAGVAGTAMVLPVASGMGGMRQEHPLWLW